MVGRLAADLGKFGAEGPTLPLHLLKPPQERRQYLPRNTTSRKTVACALPIHGETSRNLLTKLFSDHPFFGKGGRERGGRLCWSLASSTVSVLSVCLCLFRAGPRFPSHNAPARMRKPGPAPDGMLLWAADVRRSGQRRRRPMPTRDDPPPSMHTSTSTRAHIHTHIA